MTDLIIAVQFFLWVGLGYSIVGLSIKYGDYSYKKFHREHIFCSKQYKWIRKDSLNEED